MAGFGSPLREARESQHISLLQAEQALKIKAHYLQAIEDEDLASLPAPVYVRGFLRSYARLLGVDPEEIVSQYRQSSGSEPSLAVPPQTRGGHPPRLALTMPAIITAVAVLAVGAFSYYIYHQVSQFHQVASRTSPTPSFVPSTQDSPIPSPASSPTPSPSPSPTSGMSMVISLTGTTWLQITVDGQSPPLYSQTFAPGTTLNLHASHDIDILSGVPAYTMITIDGRNLGAMGAPGTVLQKDYLASQY